MTFATWARRVGAAAAILVVVGVGASADDNWVPVTGGNGDFHFLAPTEPKVETSNDTDNGVPYAQTLYTSVATGFAEIGTFSDYGTANVQPEIDLVVTGFLKGMGATLISNEPMPYVRGPKDTLTGALVSARSDKATCHVRLVIDHARIYGLAACGLTGYDATAEMDRAIASFTITK
ncbi:MAG: hypothetical protein KGJ78_00975 [Alphaproteobacteria bacterium]|nr:hypothetical protein [Alphaproteobacteria bacterium]